MSSPIDEDGDTRAHEWVRPINISGNFRITGLPDLRENQISYHQRLEAPVEGDAYLCMIVTADSDLPDLDSKWSDRNDADEFDFSDSEF